MLPLTALRLVAGYGIGIFYLQGIIVWVLTELIGHEWCSSKAQINGTMAHATAIFGFTIAGLVMNDIYQKALTEAK